MGSFKAWTVPAEDVTIMHAVKVCGQEWKKSCSTAVRTSRRTTLWKSWRLWSGDIIWVTGLTEESAPPTVGFLRQPEESSTMIISFSLHNSCSNKMCQVILTKPTVLFLLIRLVWLKDVFSSSVRSCSSAQSSLYFAAWYLSCVRFNFQDSINNSPFLLMAKYLHKIKSS